MEIINDGNVVFINNFLTRIENLRKENIISCSIEYCNDTNNDLVIVEGNEIKFPKNILCFYNQINSLNITEPRQFEFLLIKNMSIIKNRYLHFSNINSKGKINFDIVEKNDTEEWDIINLSNNYLITMTIGSFLTNKIWAWIDRGREIWKEENYIK